VKGCFDRLDEIWYHEFENVSLIYGAYLNCREFSDSYSRLFSLRVPFISPKGLSHSFQKSIGRRRPKAGKETIMTRNEKFEEDLNLLLSKLTHNVSEEAERKLAELKKRLIQLHRENVVKINHSVMELVCAKHLVEKGYDVLIEHPLEGGLTCDLFAVKGYGSLIVEIETGFVPPEHALDPSTYISARIASKIIRYSSHAGKFALGIPPHYVLQFPLTFTQPPRERKPEESKAIKNLCDLHYQNPPVSLEEIKDARIHVVYIIDVDETAVREVEPEAYAKK